MARPCARPGVPRHRRDGGIRVDPRLHDRARLPLPDRRAGRPPARPRRHGDGGRRLPVRDPDGGGRRPLVAALVGDHRPRRHRRRAADRGDDGVVRRACSSGRRCGASPTRSRAVPPWPGSRARWANPTGPCCAGCSCVPAGWGRPAHWWPSRCRSCSASTWPCGRRSSSAASCRSPSPGGSCGRWPSSTSSRCRRRTARRGTPMVSSAAAGVRAIRASHVLLFLTLALFLAGGASEAYDRYIEKFLLGLDNRAGRGGRR